jgi:hypothetical protein
MKKHLAALAMLAAAFSFVLPTSKANAFLLNDRSPNVQAAEIIVGLSMSGAYFALTCNHGFNHCARFTSHQALKWYGLTTVGCLALSPMVGAALVGMNEHRELKSSEVFMMMADCVVPIIGGWVAKAAFDAHPEWDRGTGGPTARR